MACENDFRQHRQRKRWMRAPSDFRRKEPERMVLVDLQPGLGHVLPCLLMSV